MTYASARKRFDQDITVGKRVALAPHLDLWMAGTRYGECVDIMDFNGETMYHVKFDHKNETWLKADDLLGALH